MLPRAGLYPGSDLANRRNVWMFSFLPPKLADEARQRVDGAAPSVARGEARGCPFHGRRDEQSGGPIRFDSLRSPFGSTWRSILLRFAPSGRRRHACPVHSPEWRRTDVTLASRFSPTPRISNAGWASPSSSSKMAPAAGVAPARTTFEASPAVCYLTRRNWCAHPDLRRDYSSLGPRPTVWLPTGAWPP